MKEIIFGLFLCLLVSVSKGQSFKQLNIGDTLPPINVDYISGVSVESRSLASFYKNNFLIIDFWANWCGPCISAIAAADSVSKKFNGALKILPVTYQEPETIRPFVEGNERLKRLNLEYVINDTVLMGGYFKFKVLPHEVWVDTNGIIKAITYADEISYENVSRFTRGKNLLLSEKIDDLSFDFTKPLKIENNDFLYRAILTQYQSGLSNMLGTLSESYVENIKVNRFLAINKDILSLFYAAYSHSNGRLDYNRIELSVTDSLSLNPFLLYKKVPRQLIIKHSYCYELILPQKDSKNNFYAYLLQDLNRLFSFRASIEKRKKMCWILINNNKINNPISISKEPKLIWKDGFIKEMNSQPMSVLVSYLNWNMSLPVVDESFFSRLLDMELNLGVDSEGNKVCLNPEKVKKSLRDYGFDIIKGERYVDILVIKEKTQ